MRESFEEGVQLFKAEDGSYYVQPIRPCDENILVFDPEGQFYTEVQHDIYTPTEKRIVSEETIYGIVGYLNMGKSFKLHILTVLGFAHYLIVIKEREIVTKIDGRSIWRIVRIDMHPVIRYSLLSQDEEEMESNFLRSFGNIFQNGLMYYSYDLDLTNSLSRCLRSRLRVHHQRLDDYFESLDDRFFYNKTLLSDLLVNTKTHYFLVPVICGAVGQESFHFANKPDFSLFLVSRMSRHQSGIRSRRRGVDSFGNVAIEAETEMIVHTLGDMTSFLQIRGSIPLFWRQKVKEEEAATLFDIEAAETHASLQAFEVHVTRLHRLYGACVTLVDMIDQEQDVLGAGISRIFESTVSKCVLSDIHVVEYKNVVKEYTKTAKLGYISSWVQWATGQVNWISQYFHHRPCKDMFKCFDSHLMGQGYTHIKTEGESKPLLKRRQSGIFRTNCLDCVDDTNTAQSFLASKALFRILQDLSILTSLEKSTFHTIESGLFRLYVASGNAISQMYAGTLSKSAFEDALGRPIYHVQVDLSRLYLQLFQEASLQEDVNVFMGLNVQSTGSSIKELAAYKRQVRFREMYVQESKLLRYFFFLRSILAPKTVQGTTQFVPAMGWLATFVALKKALNIKTTDMMARTKSTDDMLGLSPPQDTLPTRSSIARPDFMKSIRLNVDTNYIPIAPSSNVKVVKEPINRTRSRHLSVD